MSNSTDHDENSITEHHMDFTSQSYMQVDDNNHCHTPINKVSDNTNNQSLNAGNCCNGSQCGNQCMYYSPLISGQKNTFLLSVDSSYPQQDFAHFYQLYLPVSSPPPVI